MIRLPAKLFILLIIGILIAFFRTDSAYAQVTSSGYATSIPLTETGLQEGDIICQYEQGFRRCEGEYDTSIYGVIVDDVAVAIEDVELENSRLVLSGGIARVRVSSVNGNINEGDFVTTSEIAGIGQLADKNGYVLGAATEAYENDNPEEVGSIQVALNIHPAAGLGGSRSNLIRFIREGIAVPVFDPVESLRYLLAILMVLISFTLGMIYFGRSSRAGIEAIGRNPLAKRAIQITVIMNIVLTIVIVLVGLGIAYLILIL